LCSPEQLRQWYEVELLSENEIARRLGTYQVNVGRLRRKYGIETITKTERIARQLPSDLTFEQEQLIVGSLLGDGWMTASSEASARFHEGHAMKQASYTDWKADQLRPFTSKRYPTTKRQGGREYPCWYFATKSCTVLRPYYDLFYPTPERKRVFPSDLYKRMTPLVLSVWYMDDGSVTKSGHPRIHFGLDPLSLKRALRALRTLGLTPKAYGEEGDKAIWFPKQSHAFCQLIEPYVSQVPCMVYKLPTETLRQEGDRNARKLTAEVAANLYDGGMSTKEIGRLYDVSPSTVSRRLSSAEVVKRRSGPRSLSYTQEASSSLLAGYDSKKWSDLPPTTQDTWVAEVLQVLRVTPFPTTPAFDRVAALKALGKVVSAEMRLEDSRVMPIRTVGIGCCSSYFPNRYKGASRGTRTAYEAWYNDRELERAVRFQFRVGDPVQPHRVLRAVTMNCRTPSVFRPTLARFIYDRYCPPGGKVWDPCAGFGGRLFGACAAGVQYVGTDVDQETVTGNLRLAEALGYLAEVHLCPAEEFDAPEVDLVFTSSPYFNRELYSHGANQSWVRHGDDFESWVEGFLRPVIRKAYQVSPRLVLNVSDIRVGKVVVPLEETTVRVALEEGFQLEETLYMPLPKLNRTDPKEPFLVFSR